MPLCVRRTSLGDGWAYGLDLNAFLTQLGATGAAPPAFGFRQWHSKPGYSPQASAQKTGHVHYRGLVRWLGNGCLITALSSPPRGQR